jgi:hypothetical protein
VNPLSASHHIQEAYRSYLRSTFALGDPSLREQFERALDEGVALTSGPYLQATPPFTPGASLDDLVREGLLSTEFRRIPTDVFPLARALHQHQETAIRRALDGRNLLIATGTGSGKTECILFPTIELLLREHHAGTLTEPGVRAMLLYPMNALANDQLRRFRKMLEVFPELTFGRYIGATRETRRQAEDTFRVLFPGEQPLPNELLSREEMRAKPPHILLTNFSMLEYLLLRPEDTAFFDGPTRDHWRLIALDEAHVYDGADGAEIAMLLRRVRDRVVNSEPGRLNYFATSATLGKGESDYPLLRAFGEALFDERFEWEPTDPKRQDIVGPTVQRLSVGKGRHRLPPASYGSLRLAFEGGASPAELAAAAGDIPSDVADQVRTAPTPGAALNALLSCDQRLVELQAELESRVMTIDEATKLVIADGTREDLVSLVELGGFARTGEGEISLVPARYHFWMRGLEGAFVCLRTDRHPAGEPTLRLQAGDVCSACDRIEVASTLFELAACRKCRAEYIVGVERAGAVRRAPIGTSPQLHLLLRDPDEVGDQEDDEDEEGDEDLEADARWLCSACGQILTAKDEECGCDDDPTRVAVTMVRRVTGEDDTPLRKCEACRQSSSGGDMIGRFLTDTNAPAAVIATAIYEELPEASDPDIAAKIGGGRKLLAFADSRQEAAFFAPYLERTYAKVLHRSLILSAIDRVFESDPLRLSDIDGKIVDIATPEVLDPSDSGATRRRQVRTWLMQELMALDRRQTVDGVGLVRVGLALPPSAPSSLDVLGLTQTEALGLTALLLDTLRSGGVLTFPPDVSRSDEAFAPRNGDWAVRGAGSKRSQQLISWNGKNRRREIVTKVIERKGLGLNPDAILDGLWAEMALDTRSPIYKAKILVPDTDRKRGPFWRLSHEKVEFLPARAAGERRRCSRCRELWWHNVVDICPTYHCDGTLEAVPADAPLSHYAALYGQLAPLAMKVQEHTAQWALERGTKIQTEFITGDLNVLSCSTTFELGVDVGDVEAVLMRNVPPSPANYVQRAGRAGRRAGAAAMVMTLAQRRNHDLSWFRNPSPMIRGSVEPPHVIVDNPVIARRHAHSVAFAQWLRTEPMSKVGEFVLPDDSGSTGDARFMTWLHQHPLALIDALRRILPDEVAEHIGLESWQWVDELTSQSGDDPSSGWLDRAGSEARADLARIDEAIEIAIAEKQPKRWDWLLRQKATITADNLIGFLARKNVLPKYGFPVDVVELDLSLSGVDAADGIELDRDMRLAISEYAPGNEVVAAKLVWQSVGLKTHAMRGWRIRQWAVCASCGRYRDSSALAEEALIGACQVCGDVEPKQYGSGEWVQPIFGFVGVGSSSQVGETPVSRRASIQSWFDDYGEAATPEPRTPAGIWPDSATTLLSRQGRIIVVNQGPQRRGFRICSACGWAEPTPVRPKPKADTKPHHVPGKNIPCNGKPDRRQLGHDFLTDVVQVRIAGSYGDSELRSTLYALLEGAGRLGIKRDEIDGTLHTWKVGETQSLVLFDTVPGGAGHARRIEENFAEVAKAALARVRDCECGPETSCYACLRSYSNQIHHENLVRGRAATVLERLLP